MVLTGFAVCNSLDEALPCFPATLLASIHACSCRDSCVKGAAAALGLAALRQGRRKVPPLQVMMARSHDPRAAMAQGAPDRCARGHATARRPVALAMDIHYCSLITY